MAKLPKTLYFGASIGNERYAPTFFEMEDDWYRFYRFEINEGPMAGLRFIMPLRHDLGYVDLYTDEDEAVHALMENIDWDCITFASDDEVSWYLSLSKTMRLAPR